MLAVTLTHMAVHAAGAPIAAISFSAIVCGVGRLVQLGQQDRGTRRRRGG